MHNQNTYYEVLKSVVEKYLGKGRNLYAVFMELV